MKSYVGIRSLGGTSCTVKVQSDGVAFPLRPRLDLLGTHSPVGFEWGYRGSGAAHLAVAILADSLGDELAQDHYQNFKAEVIAGLPREGWQLTELDIRQWLNRRAAKASDA